MKNDEEWEMKDGNKIMVSEMTESHAKNCLCLLIRRIREHNTAKALQTFANDLDAIQHEDYGDRG